MANKRQTVHMTDLSSNTSSAEAPEAVAPPMMDDLILPDLPPSPVAVSERRAVARTSSSSPSLSSEPRRPRAWPVYLVASGVAAITALTPLFYVIGYRGGVQPLVNEHFVLAVVILLAVLPALLVMMAAYLLQQGRRLAAEARYNRSLANRLLAPAAMAAAKAGEAAEALRGQIVDVVEAANIARDRVHGLREALAGEIAELQAAAAISVRTAGDLATQLGRERQEMAALGATLDAQSASVADTIARQAQMVAEASDLAEAQLREAEAVLATRAADLAAAAGEASDAARTVGEDLGRQVTRMETAGVGISEQMQLVGESLAGHRAGLLTTAHALRAEQEDFALQAESRQAQLNEFIVQARLGAAEVGDSAGRGAQALGELIGTARERLGELAMTAHAERQALVGDAEGQMIQMGQLFDTRRAQLQAEFASINQAAGDALEDRMSEARSLVEGSAKVIEQAGAAAVQRLDHGVTEARRALVEMQRLLAEIDERTGRLPKEAQEAAQQVRTAVEQGIDELLVQARRAAEETQAIDAAFQTRVKRNYEMLSEAVKLMGAASESPRTAAQARPAELAPPAPAAPAADLPLRGRLRLTPAEPVIEAQFESQIDPLDELADAPSAPPASENFSWRQVFSGIENEEQAGFGDVVAQVRGMGIDAVALLPKSKVEDIAAALQRRDLGGARETVRRLAPAAIRRLVRRLFSDSELKGQVDRFLRRYSSSLNEAVEQDRGVVVVASLLATDAGRNYLLLDAALGELG